MEYSWSAIDIKKKIDILKERRKEAKTDEQLDYYNSIIPALESYWIKTSLKENKFVSPLAQRLFDAYLHHRSFEEEYDDLTIIIEEISSLLKELNQYDLPITGMKKEPVKDNDLLFEYIRDFYRQFDKENYKYFDKVYQLRKNHFCYSKSSNGYGGECLYIPELKENYIWIGNFNFFTNLCLGIHECGHAIANLIRDDCIASNNINFVAEVESFFPQFVSLDYFIEHHPDNKKEIALPHYLELTTYLDYAQNEVMSKILVKYWLKKGLRTNGLLREISKSYHINKKFLNNSLNINSDSFMYIISFLVSVELYYMYQEDKDKALWIYNKIINAGDNEYYIDILDEDILLGDHMQDYTLSLLLKTDSLSEQQINNLLLKLKK